VLLRMHFKSPKLDPARDCPEEAIGVSRLRTRVKRRKAFMMGESAHGDEARFLSDIMSVLATRSRQSSR
jgi:hypothetical protein